MTDMEWTSDKIDLLRKYLDDGYSCSGIAKLMGVTRNAVIGKLHRLSLSRPPQVKQRAKRAKLMAKRAPKNSRRFNPAALLPAMTKPAEKLVPRDGKAADSPCSLLDLRWNSCRWPYGDPQDADFHFCGGDAVDGKPYCRDHLFIAMA